jgi:hypothetical protein
LVAGATLAKMDQVRNHVSDEVDETLARELRVVSEAVAFVASGGSARVVVAGLCLTEYLLEPATRLADDAGVRLVPLSRRDGDGIDVAIEARDGA